MEMIDVLNKTFDVKFALSALYLWLLFGFLSSMVSCDLQRWMMSNWLFRHVIGIISFLLLFTIIDTSNQVSINILIAKTLIVYFIFILMTKSKWYYALPVLILLTIDQLCKAQVDYYNKDKEKYKNKIENFIKIREILSVLIVLFIIIGFVSYTIRQKNEYKEKFSINRLLFSHECKIKL